MTVLTIVHMGHPVLARPARPVADPTAPEIARLAADMVDTLAATTGVGLAAPQVGVDLRLVVLNAPAARGEAVPLTILINPWLEVLGRECESAYEGCLSLPGLTGVVPRAWRIRYGGVGLDGAAVVREAQGFHARLVQHECDHLDGRLYVSRMADLSTLAYSQQLLRLQAEAQPQDRPA